MRVYNNCTSVCSDENEEKKVSANDIKRTQYYRVLCANVVVHTKPVVKTMRVRKFDETHGYANVHLIINKMIYALVFCYVLVKTNKKKKRKKNAYILFGIKLLIAEKKIESRNRTIL
jgi:hypothetical protein